MCNAVQVEFPLEVAAEARALYETHISAQLDRAWNSDVSLKIEHHGTEYYMTNPPSSWNYRLQWIYADSVSTFSRFQVGRSDGITSYLFGDCH